MNNIFLNNDPLLNQPIQYPQYNPYQMDQSQIIPKDWLGELDKTIKGLDTTIVEQLNTNEEFVSLHSNIQNTIQEEIMNLVKNKLNMSYPIIENVKRQLSIFIPKIAPQVAPQRHATCVIIMSVCWQKVIRYLV